MQHLTSPQRNRHRTGRLTFRPASCRLLPSHYLLQLRVEAARRLLERSDRGLKQIASSAGFGSVDVMRRAFVRSVGLTPRRYRELE